MIDESLLGKFNIPPTHDETVHPTCADAHDANLITEVSNREKALTILEDALSAIKVTVPAGNLKIIAIEQFQVVIGTVRLAFDSMDKS